jgi:hypothetical protein
MRTHKKHILRIALLAGLLVAALAACRGVAGGDFDEPVEEIPPGMGLARIHLSSGAAAKSARTVGPNISGLYFTLEFTAPGKTAVNVARTGGGSLTVALEPAVWRLEVKGYDDSSMSTLRVAGGITSVPITAGTSASFDVYLTPNFASGGAGSLAYNISLPAGARGHLGLYPIDNTPGTSTEIDLSPFAGGAASGTLTALPVGAYQAVIALYDRAGNKAAGDTKVVHIHDGLSTPFSRVFTTIADFAACAPLITGTSLGAKLDAALASESGSYTIALDGTETDLAAFAPKTLDTGKTLRITIHGGGNTVQVDRTGTSLLTTSWGLGLTVEFQDITLRGRAGNSVPVVQVIAGTLTIKAGCRITGNTTSSAGGGVSVTYGTLNMDGGAISGNTSGYGGGVFVGSGTLTMSGGAISGNTCSSAGGGVFVDSGTLTMSGGAISGNTCSSNGGGVAVLTGTLTMSGGAISGNTSSSSYYSSSGGGVYVSEHGTLNMNGGAISGNISSSSSSYYSSSGGGVCVSGTMNMSGGTIGGNILSGADGYGKEVLISYSGTLKMSGDANIERVFFYSNTSSITIAGPLSGGVTPIDLGVTSSLPLTNYIGAPILKLDSSYSGGDLASLSAHFLLGNAKLIGESPYTETAITGYTISDGGLFVAE